VTGDPNGRHGHAMPLWSERIMVALPEDHHLAAKEISRPRTPITCRAAP
jgi:DNA-binding transcriptional LysR family regulator